MKYRGLLGVISAIIMFLSFTTTTKAALVPDNNENGDLGITIDGNFDDWADKTKHPMKMSWDNDNIKYASLLSDNKNIYFYIMMNPKLSGGYTNFQPSGYTLSTGGKVFYISFNNNQTVNLQVGQKQAVSMNIYNSDANVDLNDQAYVARQKIDQKMGDGKTVKGTGYVWEVAVPLKDLHGISDVAGQTIKLENNALWSGSLETTGGSTGPIVLASAGFLIAIGGLLKFRKRNQQA